MTMTGPGFDVWMLRRAREKPSNPIYAHMVGRSRIDSMEKGEETVETPVPAQEIARSVANPAVVAQTAKTDFKSAAAGEDWDGYEPPEEGNQ